MGLPGENNAPGEALGTQLTVDIQAPKVWTRERSWPVSRTTGSTRPRSHGGDATTQGRRGLASPSNATRSGWRPEGGTGSCTRVRVSLLLPLLPFQSWAISSAVLASFSLHATLRARRFAGCAHGLVHACGLDEALLRLYHGWWWGWWLHGCRWSCGDILTDELQRRFCACLLPVFGYRHLETRYRGWPFLEI